MRLGAASVLLLIGGVAASLPSALTPDSFYSTWLGPESSRDGGSTLQSNALLAADQAKLLRKTGTTIVGVVCDGAVVLGADTRATEGSTVCDKSCEKVHQLAANMACCGAGTSADAEQVTAAVRRKLEGGARASQSALPFSPGLCDLSSVQWSETCVSTAHALMKRHLFKNRGAISATFVLGGVDALGPHLYEVHQHGSSDKVAFAALGSGSLAAMAFLEQTYRQDMTIAEAKEVVCAAITSGIENDLGSGSTVDLCTIAKDAYIYERGFSKLYPPGRPSAAAVEADAAPLRKAGDDGGDSGGGEGGGDGAGDSSSSRLSGALDDGTVVSERNGEARVARAAAGEGAKGSNERSLGGRQVWKGSSSVEVVSTLHLPRHRQVQQLGARLRPSESRGIEQESVEASDEEGVGEDTPPESEYLPAAAATAATTTTTTTTTGDGGAGAAGGAAAASIASPWAVRGVAFGEDDDVQLL